MINSYVVAVSGTHGTGKTTSVYNLARMLKIAHPDKTVAPLIEQASVCPYDINGVSSGVSQMWLFTSQIARELELLSQFDIVVSDRCVVDVIAYTRFFGFEDLADNMFSLAWSHMTSYRQIYFRDAELNEFCFPDGLRDSSDRVFRQEVQRIMLDVYKEMGLTFKRCPDKGITGARLCEPRAFFEGRG